MSKWVYQVGVELSLEDMGVYEVDTGMLLNGGMEVKIYAIGLVNGSEGLWLEVTPQSEFSNNLSYSE